MPQGQRVGEPPDYLALLVTQLHQQEPVSAEEGQRFVNLLVSATKTGGSCRDWDWMPIWQAIYRVGFRPYNGTF